MSKIANMLKMVEILSDKQIHSIKELAEILEVSPRMIRVYKTELEQAGIYIDSVRGIYGGYIIDDVLNSIDIGFTSQDLDLLNEIDSYILKIKDFVYKDEYEKIITKIQNAYAKNKEQKDNINLNSIQNNNLRTLYKDFRMSINNKNKVYIEYVSLNSGNTKRIVHPAEMFSYMEDWYIAAFCEKRKEIRLFKLKNITCYKILDEKYDETFQIKK